jgi:protein O-mannosyl-transferase
MNLRPLFICLLLIFISFGVYYPTLFAPYNSLDDQLLAQQLLNQGKFSLQQHFAPGGTYDYYRPILTLTYEIDKYVGGLQESFMHLMNILIHTLNVVLIFLIARRFSGFVNRKGNLLPFLAAVIFCIHPINTEAVNWISARTDLLAGTFVFSSLLFILIALERRSLLWGFAGALALLSGALCKETALFLVPGVFLLLAWKPLANNSVWPERWVIFCFCLLAVSGYFALRWGAYTSDRGLSYTAKFVKYVASSDPIPRKGAIVSNKFPILEAFRVAIKVSGYYVCKLFEPLPLKFAINHVNEGFLLPGVIMIIALPVLAIRRSPVGVFFILSAIIGSSALLVVFTRLAWTPVSERYMYIPCGLFAVAMVFGSAFLVDKTRCHKISIAVIIFLLFVSAFFTVNRNIVWQDNLTLYQDTVLKSPDFGPARNELAIAYYAHNRKEQANSLIATTRIPFDQASSLNRAAVLAEQGRYSEARGILLQRLEKPGLLEIDILTMLLKVNTKMAEKSLDEKEKILLYRENIIKLERLEHITHNPFYWYRLGQLHLILKDRQQAQECFSKAANRLPVDSIYKAPAEKLARELLI